MSAHSARWVDIQSWLNLWSSQLYDIIGWPLWCLGHFTWPWPFQGFWLPSLVI
jgi:hypothetical protein